jgi:hypothetical protein
MGGKMRRLDRWHGFTQLLHDQLTFALGGLELLQDRSRPHVNVPSLETGLHKYIRLDGGKFDNHLSAKLPLREEVLSA